MVLPHFPATIHIFIPLAVKYSRSWPYKLGSIGFLYQLILCCERLSWHYIQWHLCLLLARFQGIALVVTKYPQISSNIPRGSKSLQLKTTALDTFLFFYILQQCSTFLFSPKSSKNVLYMFLECSFRTPTYPSTDIESLPPNAVHQVCFTLLIPF